MPHRRKSSYDPSEPLHGPLPDRIAVMPVKSTVIFPTGATGLQVGFPPNVEVLGLNPGKSLVVGLVTTEDEDLPIDPAALQKVGVLARVLNRLNLPGGLIQATMQGVIRIQLEEIRFESGYYSGFPRLIEETPASQEDADRLIERILTTLGGIGAKVERLADVPRVLSRNVGDPGRFADLVASLAHFSVAEKDEVLQRLDVRERLEYVLGILEAEWQHLLERPTAGAQEAADRADPASSKRPIDRGGELRRQISALQAELGELDPTERETVEMLRRIDRAQLPSRVASIARREAERLRATNPSSLDAAEIRNYVEVLLTLPWDRLSESGEIDLVAVRRALDERQMGLDEVKRRVLEILSVGLLRGNLTGLIPCIVGPPGVGKRRMTKAIAQGLSRPLVRVELGGRGETQLAGGRRSRNGAQPGKLIGAFREAAVRDAVYVLEEIDEIGLGNVEGDPVEALEEFLDRRHREAYVDRYVEVPFDLSEAVFIATATDFMRIPRSIREHLIEIRIAGYTPEEKVEIASSKLLPELIRDHGLEEAEVEISPEALVFLTRGYARDAGLGNLRRALSAILRYIAHRKATGVESSWALTRPMIEDVLGTPRYPTTSAESAPEVGVVTGLAWTASGGELMFIEALKMAGSGRLIITGYLGEVMRESVSAAYSYVRSRAEQLGVPAGTFGEHDIHIHFPVGATPKDGPSAGAAVTLAIASSLSERAVRHDIAMTGEVTLRGRILEIGGVKEKILAAYRAGIRRVILPAGNERDLRDVPEDVREGITFHFVDRMDEVFDLCLLAKKRTPRQKKPVRRASAGGQTRQAARPHAADEDARDRAGSRREDR
jgi:ATP-dependent Lon protease